METFLLVLVGLASGVGVVGLLVFASIRRPTRSVRREQSTWNDTNHSSGNYPND